MGSDKASAVLVRQWHHQGDDLFIANWHARFFFLEYSNEEKYEAIEKLQVGNAWIIVLASCLLWFSLSSFEAGGRRQQKNWPSFANKGLWKRLVFTVILDQIINGRFTAVMNVLQHPRNKRRKDVHFFVCEEL